MGKIWETSLKNLPKGEYYCHVKYWAYSREDYCFFSFKEKELMPTLVTPDILNRMIINHCYVIKVFKISNVLKRENYKLISILYNTTEHISYVNGESI